MSFDLQVGDQIMYCVNPKSAAAKYEKNFPGVVLKVCKTRVRVCVRNSRGKEIIKDVSRENLKRLEVEND